MALLASPPFSLDWSIYETELQRLDGCMLQKTLNVFWPWMCFEVQDTSIQTILCLETQPGFLWHYYTICSYFCLHFWLPGIDFYFFHNFLLNISIYLVEKKSPINISLPYLWYCFFLSLSFLIIIKHNNSTSHKVVKIKRIINAGKLFYILPGT